MLLSLFSTFPNSYRSISRMLIVRWLEVFRCLSQANLPLQLLQSSGAISVLCAILRELYENPQISQLLFPLLIDITEHLNALQLQLLTENENLLEWCVAKLAEQSHFCSRMIFSILEGSSPAVLSRFHQQSHLESVFSFWYSNQKSLPTAVFYFLVETFRLFLAVDWAKFAPVFVKFRAIQIIVLGISFSTPNVSQALLCLWLGDLIRRSPGYREMLLKQTSKGESLVTALQTACWNSKFSLSDRLAFCYLFEAVYEGDQELQTAIISSLLLPSSGNCDDCLSMLFIPEKHLADPYGPMIVSYILTSLVKDNATAKRLLASFDIFSSRANEESGVKVRFLENIFSALRLCYQELSFVVRVSYYSLIGQLLIDSDCFEIPEFFPFFIDRALEGCPFSAFLLLLCSQDSVLNALDSQIGKRKLRFLLEELQNFPFYSIDQLIHTERLPDNAIIDSIFMRYLPIAKEFLSPKREKADRPDSKAILALQSELAIAKSEVRESEKKTTYLMSRIYQFEMEQEQFLLKIGKLQETIHNLRKAAHQSDIYTL